MSDISDTDLDSREGQENSDANATLTPAVSPREKTKLVSHKSAIEELLVGAGCEEFIPVFKEHDIDIDVAVELEEQDLKDLFPKIGQRKRFQKKIAEYSKSVQTKLGQNSREFDNLLITYQDDFIVKFSDKDQTEAENNTRNQDTEELTNKDRNEAENNNKNQDIVELTNDVQHEAKNNKRSTLDGRAVLREGAIGGGLLKEGSRRKLSQLLIADILEKKSSKSIDPEEFHSLALEISDLFKKESVVVYYSAYVSSADGRKQKNASGKLYESYICRRRKLRELGDLPKSKRSSSVSSVSNASSDTVLSELEEDYQENISWLKSNVEPWQTVEEKWKQTEDIRLKEVQAGEGKIETYLKDFPALRTPQGYRLFLNDFERMYPQKSNNLFSKIVLKAGDIIKYATTKLKVARDKSIINRLQELLTLVDETNLETSINIALMLLPVVINICPTRKSSKKKIPWKPSRAEISEGFIAQAASEGEVTMMIIEKKEKFGRLQRTVQPYVIVVGSPANVKRAYVVVNDTLYAFQKLVTAVDCAFKTFQAIGACYSEEVEDLWTSIQIGFYEITTKHDRKTQPVNVLLTDLLMMH